MGTVIDTITATVMDTVMGTVTGTAVAVVASLCMEHDQVCQRVWVGAGERGWQEGRGMWVARMMDIAGTTARRTASGFGTATCGDP